MRFGAINSKLILLHQNDFMRFGEVKLYHYRPLGNGIHDKAIQ